MRRWSLTPEVFYSFVQTFGLPFAILIVVLWTGSRGLWVFGRTHDEVVEDRNYWRQVALRGTDLAKDGADLAKEAVVRRPRRGARP